jgi:hypothetical protein
MAAPIDVEQAEFFPARADIHVPPGVLGPASVSFDVRAFVVRRGDDIGLVDALMQPEHCELISDGLGTGSGEFRRHQIYPADPSSSRPNGRTSRGRPSGTAGQNLVRRRRCCRHPRFDRDFSGCRGPGRGSPRTPLKPRQPCALWRSPSANSQTS